jgi:hypothetical protein
MRDVEDGTAFAQDPERVTQSGVAPTDDGPPIPPAILSPVPSNRRIAASAGALAALLALLLVGTYELRGELHLARVLDAVGLSRFTGTGDGSRSDLASSAPVAVTPPIAGSTGTLKSREPESTVPHIETTQPTPTEATAADAEAAKSTASDAAAMDTPSGGIAGASPHNLGHPPVAPVAPAAATASQTTRAAQQRAARAPTSPREACGARTQFSLYRCMQTQCSQSRWASNAQCEHLRATDSVD